MAGISCISKVSEPGASVNTTLVFSRHQVGNAGADERVIIGGFDAKAGQHLVAELARREIGAVGHQQMIAGGEQSRQAAGNGREARRRGDGAGTAFQLRHGGFQVHGRGCAEAPVVHHVELVADLFLQLRHRFRQDRGATVNRRVDRAVEVARMPAGVDDAGILVHDFVVTPVYSSGRRCAGTWGAILPTGARDFHPLASPCSDGGGRKVVAGLCALQNNPKFLRLE